MNSKDKADPRGAMSPAVGAAFDRAAARLPKGEAERVSARMAGNQLEAVGGAGEGLAPDARALLRALALEALARPHPSGWPEMREDELAAMTGLPPKARAAAMRALLEAGLAQLRVSGRKRPTVCARLPWLPGPEGEPVLELEIGPAALDALAEALGEASE